MRNKIIAIARKELLGFINAPLAYVIIVPFLLITNFLYLRVVLITGEATLRPYFTVLPWFLLLLAPALAMKSLSEENRGKTLELLLAHPLTELQIVMGKFFGLLGFYLLLLITTATLPITLLAFSSPDLGQIIGQYLGAFFVGAAFMGIGLTASSFTKNAIAAFLTAAVASLILLLAGMDMISLLLPGPLAQIVSQLAVLNHTENFARGVFDLRDVFYFLTVITISILLATTKIAENRLAEKLLERQKLNFALMLSIGIGLFANILLSYYPLRLDLTLSRLYTLSAGTRQTVSKLPDIVTISFYSSTDLPPQMQAARVQIIDLLKDYERLGKNLKVRVVDPRGNPGEAENAGVQKIQFNRLGSERLEVQTGYLGINIRYGDKTETLPVITETSDLESQLTRRIRKLTSPKEKTIGLYETGQGNPSQVLNEIIKTQYPTQSVNLENQGNWGNLAALIVIDDGSSPATQSAVIKNFLNNGGKILFLSSGVSINSQFLFAQKSPSVLADALKDWGITINKNLVYDLQLNEILAFGRGNQQYLAPYPFWLRSLPTTNSQLLTNVKSVSMGWPSSITLDKKSDVKYTELLTTGPNGGKVEDNFNVQPDSINTLLANPKEKQMLAVLAEKGQSKAIVVSSALIAADQFMQNNPDNAAFLSGAIDFLAADPDVAAIPARSTAKSVFVFKDQFGPLIVQITNLAVPPLIIITFAIYWLRRRKILAQRNYVQ
jgi:ABC-2 type transport system permease protein